MSAAARGALPGPDGLLRCPWSLGTPEYLGYHDDEWGRPVLAIHPTFTLATRLRQER